MKRTLNKNSEDRTGTVYSLESFLFQKNNEPLKKVYFSNSIEDLEKERIRLVLNKSKENTFEFIYKKYPNFPDDRDMDFLPNRV